MSASTEHDLLTAARAGDPSALETLLARYQDRVFRFGMKMCRHPEDAEDVVQETLLQMARSIRDFRGASSLSTWLYTIARSYCVKKRRRSKFAPEHEQSLETDGAREAGALEANARPPDEIASDRQVEAVLEQAISALEPENREILLLRDAEGLTAAEVAEVVGISVAAVKSRLHRARVQVRDRVAPILREGSAAPGAETDDSAPRPRAAQARALGSEAAAAAVAAAAAAAAACPDVLTLYSKHLEGDISASLCSEMERHIDACSRCRHLCDSLKSTLALCSAAPKQKVPRRVQQIVRDALREIAANEAAGA